MQEREGGRMMMKGQKNMRVQISRMYRRRSSNVIAVNKGKERNNNK